MRVRANATTTDYTKLLTLLPSGSAQYIETRRKLTAVKPRAEAAQKKETSEMLDKLKGIGNSILGTLVRRLGVPTGVGNTDHDHRKLWSFDEQLPVYT